MYTYEQTEKTNSGLDVAVKDKDGVIIAWCYTKNSAMAICLALNNVNDRLVRYINQNVEAGAEVGDGVEGDAWCEGYYTAICDIKRRFFSE